MFRFRALALGPAFAVVSFCQTTSATLFGIVTDPSGGAVPNASIRVGNDATGVGFVSKSDGQGEFVVTNLPSGRYSVVVDAGGFRQMQQSGIELTTGQRLRLAFTLSVGDVGQAVTVTGEVPVVVTTTAEQRTTISETQVKELPVSRRDWTNVLALTTGMEGTRMNGLPGLGFKYTIDGGEADGNPEAPSLGMYLNFNFIKGVSLEAVSEVNVTKGIAPAEIANAMSGGISLTTKGGTNQYHGTVFLNNQTENIAARNQFLATRTPLVFNQFGFSLGGPIVKNKLFAFGVYEGYRLRAFRPLVANVPTPEFRARALAAVPAYRPYLERFPNPNVPYAVGAVTGVFNGAGSSANNDNHADFRVDYNFSDHDFLAIRYSRGRPDQLIPRVTTNPQTITSLTEAGNINFTHLRPTWTSETRFAYNQNDMRRDDKIYFDGVPGIVCCLGFSDAGETLSLGGPSRGVDQVIAKTVGRHTMKFGGLWSNRFSGRENVEAPAIQYASMEDFLANIPNVAQVTYGVNPFRLRVWQVGLFAQNDFRVSRRLMINAGIRYDYVSVPRERDSRAFNRDGFFGYGALRDPQRGIYNADKLNLSPRIGFAWTLDNDAKTVVRGGAGAFHTPHNLFGGPVETVRNALDEPGRYVFNRQEIVQYGLRYPITNAATLPIVKSPNFPWSGTVINPNFPNPYSLQWTLSVQRSLARNTVLESSYVGTRGLKLNMVRDVNQLDRITGLRPVANFGTYRYYDTSDASFYHSWQNSLRKRLSSGLVFTANYTYAQNLSYGDGDLSLPGSRPQDNFNLRLDRGPTGADIRHRFISDFLYELPLLKLAADRTGRGLRLLLGGWQVAGIVNTRTGSPFTVVQSSAIPGSRPDYTGGEAVLGNYRQTLQFLNRSAFALVPTISGNIPTRLGNLGRNALRGPGAVNVDLALSKSLRFSERHTLQLRADAFNAFNHTNLGGISANLFNNPLFGRLTAAGARTVQLNARFVF
jgi:hypothetical protein